MLFRSEALKESRRSIEKRTERLNYLMAGKLEKEKHRLALDASRLEGLSPLKKLSAGYGFVQKKSGEALRSVTQAEPGEIIGVTGSVACGKSTFGKTFLCEYPYEGSITFGGRELQELTDAERSGSIGYLGHDPELFDDTIRNNILLGKDEDPGPLHNVLSWISQYKKDILPSSNDSTSFFSA